MVRRRFLSDLDALDHGKDPKAIVRDAETNKRIDLPVAERRRLAEGRTRADYLKDPFARRALQDYVFQAGQPPEVRNALLAALGINATQLT